MKIKTRPRSITVAVRVPADLHDRAVTRAQSDFMSLASFIRKALYLATGGPAPPQQP